MVESVEMQLRAEQSAARGGGSRGLWALSNGAAGRTCAWTQAPYLEKEASAPPSVVAPTSSLAGVSFELYVSPQMSSLSFPAATTTTT